uniref:Uncharacterized protein n=1 Tax=Photinus pyralis TaxID=7054 RepID=A0A1Y1LY17_PHOPY
MATANPARAMTPATRLLPKAVGAAAGFDVVLGVPVLELLLVPDCEALPGAEDPGAEDPGAEDPGVVTRTEEVMVGVTPLVVGSGVIWPMVVGATVPEGWEAPEESGPEAELIETGRMVKTAVGVDSLGVG